MAISKRHRGNKKEEARGVTDSKNARRQAGFSAVAARTS
jgi:hypothetical protein